MKKKSQLNTSTLSLISFAMFLFFVGCGKPAEEGSGKNTKPSVDTGFAATTAFAVKVETQLEGSSTKVLEKVCEISSTTALGTVSACQVAIPEARLHYSSLYITNYSTEAVGCSVVTYQPYYYQMANTASFAATWMDAVADCSNGSPPKLADCYNGPATEIVPSFPKFTGLFYNPKGTEVHNWAAISSANSKRRGSNRWAANNLGSRAGNIVITGEGYIGASMRDYTFTCLDKWNEVNYGFVLTIQDDDVSAGNPAPGGANDHWSDWNGI